MGFTYVFIPASPNEAMQELTFDKDIVDLQDDTFRGHVEKYYQSLGGNVDREVLLAQLKERTGTDLQADCESGKMPTDMVNHMLNTTSVEIFPLQLPTKDSGFIGLSAYCDDKGVAKELEENTRLSQMAQAAGYVGQTFRGDCFVGRIFDDNEDEWKRLDFGLKDCTSDADWVKQVKEVRKNRNNGDMASLANKIGANNPAHIRPEAGEAPEGETENYRWRQVDDEVEITFKTELQKSDKKDVKVVFAKQRLKVEVKGTSLIDAALYAPTQTDENTWTLSDGIIQITMGKAEPEQWPQLLKD